MPSANGGRREPRLGIPHEVPNRIVLEILGFPPTVAATDMDLHERLSAVIDPAQRSTPADPEVVSDLWEALADRWPTVRYRLLDQVLECVMAGTGVAEWVNAYFGAMQAGDCPCEFTDRLIIAATPSLCCGIDSDCVVYHQATESSIEYTKAMLTFCITRVIRDHVLLHAAAVRGSDGIALLVGRSHTGKSTLAVHCLLSGGQLLSDDLVAVNSETGELAPFPKNVSIRPLVREWIASHNDVAELFDAGRVPCVADASKILTWPEAPRHASSMWILRGFDNAVRVESVGRSEALKAVLFSFMGRREAIANAGRGIEGLMSRTRAFAHLWQGPPMATAEFILRQV